jgi:hypothetical protein
MPMPWRNKIHPGQPERKLKIPRRANPPLQQYPRIQRATPVPHRRRRRHLVPLHNLHVASHLARDYSQLPAPVMVHSEAR